ncbi:substrate-binding domain-containing protein [Propionimicrobium sp. PCR01-08-3]|uniref:substrate-binding domain-containing protein n=1 Tax=Propionimicrobium sp. PCR01-08-3 TaxID=3052086 RepID=UPI00255C524E|nr:substrate-binding domain-containing protein [Propionimicrobium sp. PCR01-08-3]WIY81881.1 substrate-binding domain-containing protein [Propionimicrobium sp. PCR01-08-3]
MSPSDMRGHRLWLAAALAACTATAGIVGCSSGGEAGSSGSAGSGGGETYTIGVVEQQLSNPFFADLQSSAADAAKERGYDVITAESKTTGDSATQVDAIEQMIARKVDGIVLDPANATALVDVVQRARDAGITVITVNTSLDPADTANASYQTDNVVGGSLMGQYAKAQLSGAEPQIAMLDYDLSDGAAADRHNGFLEGFGITDDSPEIVGTALTESSVETGQSAMENLLSAHAGINVIYTINEPVAQGAAAAIDNTGKSGNVIVTSIDGSCSGVRSVQSGDIDATVMQFPGKMGQLAVEAIANYLENGTEPSGVNDSGTTLVTDNPVDGIDSQTVEWGLENCWGN